MRNTTQKLLLDQKFNCDHSKFNDIFFFFGHVKKYTFKNVHFPLFIYM
jgi:hypothetical protein